VRHLLKRLQITAVHVTHDREEARTVADRVITMDQLRR
jgi:ABC-type sugar transport system ATPase subunit